MAGLTVSALRAQVALGEDSSRQFKVDVRNAESLAAELAAFANSEGGTLLIGVSDDGSIPGLDRSDVARINQLVGNAASHLVRSPVSVATENVALKGGRIVMAVRVPKGLDKPYFDKNGVIWLKTGADKRRVSSKEELRRLFQITDQFHADELPTRAGVEALDLLRLRAFLRAAYNQELPDHPHERMRLLQNMNLATDDGRLNLAGLLLFGENPQFLKPQFVLKAVRFPGSTIHESEYLDAEDFTGPLEQIYAEAHAFIMRGLRKVQRGRGVNSVGVPEIPGIVFEELLVNALVHRDYLVSAPIRLFVFDDRVEIVSPGHLPNNLSVEKIRSGNSNLRNPILASFVAKGLLPYRGLGSGIQRALSAWPRIEFVDDHEGCLFTATVSREEPGTVSVAARRGGRPKAAGENRSEKTPGRAGTADRASRTGSEKSGKGSEKPASTEKSGRGSEMGRHPSTDAWGEAAEGEGAPPTGLRKSATAILQALRASPELSAEDLGRSIGITSRAVEKHIGNLRALGLLRRIGPDRGGRWEVR